MNTTSYSNWSAKCIDELVSITDVTVSLTSFVHYLWNHQHVDLHPSACV